MKALILAGGVGTRLRPLSCTRPKSLFPIVNKPLLQWTFERLAKHGISDVILAVNYQTEAAIKQHRIPKYGIHTTYSRDPLKKPLGTGGPIKKTEKQIGHSEPFLVLNGDIFSDVNYTELLKTHNEKEAIATIALHCVEDPSRYGVAELMQNGRISRFIEKPPRESAQSNLINAGTYVLSPGIFEYIPKGQQVSIERDVFPKLAEEKALYGYVYGGLWIDIGKPEDYLQINETLLDSFAYRQENKTGRNSVVREPVAFDTGVSIGEKSVIGPYVILGRNVAVGNNVHIQHSVILPGTSISDSSSIDGAILGDSVIIGEKAKIAKKCILGDHVKIRDNVTLAEGVSICPAKEVTESVFTRGNIC
ncbi:NDP-sugar synthase [Candidatus Bathyarchaeota archaeon]|nr:NDP-sugar synthase [Candidatus Bathyarchaeota archaeon]